MAGRSGNGDEGPGRALTHLAETLKSSLAGYHEAAEIVAGPALRAVVEGLIEDHERHLAEIEQALANATAPTDPPEPARAAALPLSAESPRPHAHPEWLAALVRAESLLIQDFQGQLEYRIPERHRAMIRRQLAEEHAHLAWLRESDTLGANDSPAVSGMTST